MFDEQSPSGNDYLSEVNYWNLFKRILVGFLWVFTSSFFIYFQVCREWEGTALGVDKDVRLALIRIGVVLGKDGGALGLLTFHKLTFFC